MSTRGMSLKFNINNKGYYAPIAPVYELHLLTLENVLVPEEERRNRLKEAMPEIHEAALAFLRQTRGTSCFYFRAFCRTVQYHLEDLAVDVPTRCRLWLPTELELKEYRKERDGLLQYTLSVDIVFPETFSEQYLPRPHYFYGALRAVYQPMQARVMGKNFDLATVFQDEDFTGALEDIGPFCNLPQNEEARLWCISWTVAMKSRPDITVPDGSVEWAISDSEEEDGSPWNKIAFFSPGRAKKTFPNPTPLQLVKDLDHQDFEEGLDTEDELVPPTKRSAPSQPSVVETTVKSSSKQSSRRDTAKPAVKDIVEKPGKGKERDLATSANSLRRDTAKSAVKDIVEKPGKGKETDLATSAKVKVGPPPHKKAVKTTKAVNATTGKGKAPTTQMPKGKAGPNPTKVQEKPRRGRSEKRRLDEAGEEEEELEVEGTILLSSVKKADDRPKKKTKVASVNVKSNDPAPSTWLADLSKKTGFPIVNSAEHHVKFPSIDNPAPNLSMVSHNAARIDTQTYELPRLQNATRYRLAAPVDRSAVFCARSTILSDAEIKTYQEMHSNPNTLPLPVMTDALVAKFPARPNFATEGPMSCVTCLTKNVPCFFSGFGVRCVTCLKANVGTCSYALTQKEWDAQLETLQRFVSPSVQGFQAAAASLEGNLRQAAAYDMLAAQFRYAAARDAADLKQRTKALVNSFPPYETAKVFESGDLVHKVLNGDADDVLREYDDAYKDGKLLSEEGINVFFGPSGSSA